MAVADTAARAPGSPGLGSWMFIDQTGHYPGTARPAAELLHEYLRTTGRHRFIMPVWLPGVAASAIRAGENLALAPDRAVGRGTRETFLAGRLGLTAYASAGG